MNKNEAAEIVVRDLILFQSLHSCLNCIEFSETDGKCSKFNVVPPPKVIVFSCGSQWEPTIPF